MIGWTTSRRAALGGVGVTSLAAMLRSLPASAARPQADHMTPRTSPDATPVADPPSAEPRPADPRPDPRPAGPGQAGPGQHGSGLAGSVGRPAGEAVPRPGPTEGLTGLMAGNRRFVMRRPRHGHDVAAAAAAS